MIADNYLEGILYKMEQGDRVGAKYFCRVLFSQVRKDLSLLLPMGKELEGKELQILKVSPECCFFFLFLLGMCKYFCAYHHELSAE